MEIKNLLRNNMFNKHQEIENNFEQAKINAVAIKKQDNEIDYFEWYDKKYSKDLLIEKLPVSSITDFERRYCILVDEKRASHWYYTILCGKREYDRHYIDIAKKRQFLSQLYDILVNDNADNYKETNIISKVKVKQVNDAKYLSKKEMDFYHDWYKKFNCKKFIKDNHISNYTLQRELQFSQAVISRLINKKRYSDNAIVRLYKFVEKVNSDIDYFEWFKDFDLKEYMKKNNLNNTTLGAKIGLGIVSTSQLANKKFYTKKTLEKLYRYIKQNEEEDVQDEIIEDIIEDEDDNNTTTIFERNNEIEEEIEELDTTDTSLDNSTSDIIDNSTCQVELENYNNVILRRILINRLTDEEKTLIELFGGKLC